MGESTVSSDGDHATHESSQTEEDSRSFRNDKEEHLEKMTDYKTYVKVDLNYIGTWDPLIDMNYNCRD